MQTFIAKLCISESKITGINKGLKSVYGGASTIYEWQICIVNHSKCFSGTRECRAKLTIGFLF